MASTVWGHFALSRRNSESTHCRYYHVHRNSVETPLVKTLIEEIAHTVWRDLTVYFRGTGYQIYRVEHLT